MPLFLLPFLVVAAANAHAHKRQVATDERRVEIEEKQYELNLAQWNESHSHTVKRGILVYNHKAKQ